MHPAFGTKIGDVYLQSFFHICQRNLKHNLKAVDGFFIRGCWKANWWRFDFLICSGISVPICHRNELKIPKKNFFPTDNSSHGSTNSRAALQTTEAPTAAKYPFCNNEYYIAFRIFNYFLPIYLIISQIITLNVAETKTNRESVITNCPQQ